MFQQTAASAPDLPRSFQAWGWRYTLYPLGQDRAEFGQAGKLLELWSRKQAARSHGLLPARAQFDFLDFRGLHGRIMISEVQSGPFDLLVRLWGTTQTQILNYDRTGMLLSQCGDPRFNDIEADLRYYEELCRLPAIGVREGGVFWQERDHLIISYLDLPLADDGQRVDRVLSYFSYRQENRRS